MFFKKLFSKKIVPDKPLGFGYKNKWMAIKSNSKEKVADFFKFKNIQECNWANGVKFGYDGIFITPEINGWILILGIDVFDLETSNTKELLKKVSTEFGECQLFLTHRIVEYHFWGLARNGKIERLYSYLGDSESNLIIEGIPTEIKKKYNFVNTFLEEAKNDTYWERDDIDFPNENIVMEIAEVWSINPTKIADYQDIEGIGLISNKS